MLDCRTGRPPFPRLCRTDGVPCVLLATAMEEPRAWPLGRAEGGGCRGVAFRDAMESLDFGATGVVNGCGVEGTLSDCGGEGGVGVSDTLEEVVAWCAVCRRKVPRLRWWWEMFLIVAMRQRHSSRLREGFGW